MQISSHSDFLRLIPSQLFGPRRQKIPGYTIRERRLPQELTPSDNTEASNSSSA